MWPVGGGRSEIRIKAGLCHSAQGPFTEPHPSDKPMVPTKPQGPHYPHRTSTCLSLRIWILA